MGVEQKLCLRTQPWLGSSHQWPWWLSPPQLRSSTATPAMRSSCKSRDSTLVLESSERRTHRRTEWCSEKSREETTKGSDSTATSTTLARLSLLSTLLASMVSGSWRVTTSPPEVRTLRWLLPMLPASPRSTTTSTTTTVNLSLFLSTPTTPRITLSIFWMETSPATWRAECSRPPDRDLSPSLLPPGRASPLVRSSWTGSLKVSTSTSGLSRAEPFLLTRWYEPFLSWCCVRGDKKCAISLNVYSVGLISTYSIKNKPV